MTDLLYSLPKEDIDGFIMSPRGAGHLFGKDAVDEVIH